MPTLSDIMKSISELEDQKKDLIQEAKKSALSRIEHDIGELNDLGFSYSLVEDVPTKRRRRRSGVRQDVLEVVKKSNGIKPADVAATLGMDDKSGKQAVANALSALKQSGAVTATDGVYSTT